MNITAFCFQEGAIDFGTDFPHGDYPIGALPIIKGDEEEVRKLIEANCKAGVFSSYLRYFIESVNDDFKGGIDGVNSLLEFIQELKDKNPDTDLHFYC